MDIKRYLILVKGEDKTDQIDWMKYGNRIWVIKFINSQRAFSYNYLNVVKLENPERKNPDTHVVYEQNRPISGVVEIIVFGEYVRLIFKSGYKRVYKRSSLIIEETSLTRTPVSNCFDYFKRVASLVSVIDEKEQSFLSRQFENLTAISPRSVLSSYLEGAPFEKAKMQRQVFFPFGFNLSQKTAAEKALTEQVSVIEGPPGTGKTQTILNIIANAVLNGQTVAVVSNNNSATANVLEKMQKYEVDFIAAYLGNKENRGNFFINQLKDYPDMTSWNSLESVLRSTAEALSESQKKLNEMLKYKNEQAEIKRELSQYQTEHEYFKQYLSESNYTPIDIKWKRRLKADKIMKLILEYKISSKEGKLSFRKKLYNMFAYRIYNFKLYKYPSDSVISFLQQAYYEVKISDLQAKVSELSGRLSAYNFEKAMEDFSEKSMKLFKANLAKRYTNASRKELPTKHYGRNKNLKNL
ncbi:AAA domain-containing protein [Bacillus sp. EB01]|uniref:AAA domain-containing protein n=1 Tax=Bacillus sp. EB01 TaxID=1347086 RepID=UPI000AEB9B82|nr:AAA domain-containing protein [Bacillus sp. EB01]